MLGFKAILNIAIGAHWVKNRPPLDSRLIRFLQM
jgi:hypothetical protein